MNTNPFFTSLTVNANGPIAHKTILTGLHLRILEHELHLPISDTLYAAAKAIGDIRMMEIKGVSNTAQVIELPQEEEIVCLVYQFIGNSVVSASGSHKLKSGQHTGCSSPIGKKFICRIDRGKTWMLLISITGAARRSVASEFPQLAHSPQSPLPIGFRQKRLFDQIQQLKKGAYTLDVKLNHCIVLLIERYHADLNAHLKAANSADIALYHKATAYIQRHYMERKLTRQKIADALFVSVRTLTRAFEEKQVTISKAIQLARLHKARERLRSSDDAIEQLASGLHFSDTQYFIQCYTDQFRITPDEERKKRK